MASPPPFPPPDGNGNGDGDVDGGGPGLAGASFSPITPSRSKRRIEACREAAGYRLPLPPPSPEAPSPPPSPVAAAAAAAEEVPAGAGPKSFPLLSRMGVPLGSDPTSAGCRARILGELVALGRGRGGGGGRPTHLHPYVSSNGRRGRLVRVPVRYRARPGGGEDGRHHHPALEAEERFLEASARTGFMPDLLAALGGLGEGGGKGDADEDAEEAGAEAGTATGTGTEARLRRRQRSEAEAAGAHLAARYLASEHPEAVSRVAGWAGEELAAEAFERDRRELVRADCGSPPPLPLVESRPSFRIDGGPAATVDPGADYDGTGRQGWNARYVQLTAYKQRYGNCLVPTSTELGRWVAAQRTARRRWLEEKAREEEEEKERTREDEGDDEAEGGEGRQQRRGRKRRRPDRLRDLLDRGEREGRHRGGGPGGSGGGGDDPDAFPPTVAERRFDLLDAVGGFVWNAARLGMGGRRRRPGGGGRAAAEAAAEERAGTGSASASAPGGDRRLTVALAARLAYPVLSVRECLELGGYGEEELEEVVNPKFAWRTREVLLRDKIYRTEKGWATEEEEDAAAAAASAGGGNGEGGNGEGGERRRGRKNTARRRQVRSLVGRLRDGSGGGTGVAEAEAEAFGDRAVLLPQYLAAGAARREAGVARDGPRRRRKRRPPRRRAAAAEAAQAAGPPPPSGPGACGGGGSDSDSVSVSDQGTVAEEEASAYASPAADGVVAEELMAAVEMAEAELGEDLFEADEDGSFLV